MEIACSGVKGGERVMVVWSDLGEKGHKLQEFVTLVQSIVGSSPKVAVENVERLSMCGHAKSSFHHIFSGFLDVSGGLHSLDLLGDLNSYLTPGGRLITVQPLPPGVAASYLTSNMVVAGLTPSVTPPKEVGSQENFLYTCSATKPAHEIGASRLLSFAKLAVTPSNPAPAANVWTLEDMEDDTVELVDDSTLLDESDLVKVDPASLRVCGTTGKRKACKNCSCGLAEELSDGKTPTTKSVSSSCGSCYLGDAFRCGSCPYLGMPAFKPGEKIQLSDRQLNPDLREVA